MELQKKKKKSWVGIGVGFEVIRPPQVIYKKASCIYKYMYIKFFITINKYILSFKSKLKN